MSTADTPLADAGLAHIRVAVVGAGLMGHGLAQVFATAGAQVRIHDPVPAQLETVPARIAENLEQLGGDPAAARRVALCERLADAVDQAELVIEAGPEDVKVKQSIFAELDAVAAPEAVLATNTSVISIGRIAEGAQKRDRVIGTHWWNPPYLVPLVEVIKAADTREDVVTRTVELLHAAGKTPVRVERDVPGFVGNRLQHALWREAIAIVADGICDAETVDTVVKSSFGLRLAALGPLENADLVGLDLTLAIHEEVLPHIDRTPGPSPYLRELVSAGRLGMKTGEGLRRWSPEEAQAVRRRVAAHLKAATTRPDGDRVAAASNPGGAEQ